MPDQFPTVHELRDEELRWLDEAKSMAETLFQRYATGNDGRTPEAMDAIYLAWCHDQQPDLPPLQFFYQGFGVLLGDLFRQHFDYDWKVITDEFGTETSLYMASPTPNRINSILSPLSMVGKRIRAGQPFFADVFHTIVSEHERDGFRTNAA